MNVGKAAFLSDRRTVRSDSGLIFQSRRLTLFLQCKDRIGGKEIGRDDRRHVREGKNLVGKIKAKTLIHEVPSSKTAGISLGILLLYLPSKRYIGNHITVFHAR